MCIYIYMYVCVSVCACMLMGGSHVGALVGHTPSSETRLENVFRSTYLVFRERALSYNLHNC